MQLSKRHIVILRCFVLEFISATCKLHVINYGALKLTVSGRDNFILANTDKGHEQFVTISFKIIQICIIIFNIIYNETHMQGVQVSQP